MTIAGDGSTIEHPINYPTRCNRLALLERTDAKYIQVERQFQKGWKHPKKPMPRVYAIFKILASEESLKPFLEYRARVQASLTVNSTFKNPGNEHLLFHGTNRFCLLAEDSDSVRLCALPECFLCSVIQNSFDIRKCGTKNKFRRFGTGIYTTACSSKADDYSFNGMKHSKFQVLLLNRVIVGKPLRRRQNETNLAEPPCGYHSVVGEPGVDLNYEETVIYNNNAIRPAYLVVYGSASEIHSKVHALISTLFKTPLAS